MSKFEIEISDAPFMKTFLLRYAGETLEIAAADLADLATAAQAALAEQNGDQSFPQPVRAICPERHMSAAKTCYCELDPNENSICDEPDYGGDFTTSAVCQNCDHDFVCHQPQAQRREA